MRPIIAWHCQSNIKLKALSLEGIGSGIVFSSCAFAAPERGGISKLGEASFNYAAFRGAKPMTHINDKAEMGKWATASSVFSAARDTAGENEMAYIIGPVIIRGILQ